MWQPDGGGQRWGQIGGARDGARQEWGQMRMPGGWNRMRADPDGVPDVSWGQMGVKARCEWWPGRELRMGPDGSRGQMGDQGR